MYLLICMCVCALSLSHIRLFSTPWTAAHQTPLHLGIQYQSGLPCPPSGDLPKAGTEPRSPTLQVDSLPSESPGKLKSTGVGSLSLLQGIFPTQELNPGLLLCRQILYWLSYQRNHSTSRYQILSSSLGAFCVFACLYVSDPSCFGDFIPSHPGLVPT